MESSPRSSTTASPPSVPNRTSSLRQKTSFRFFGRHKVRPDPTPPKPNRNKLVRKRHSEPTFEMVSPAQARAEDGKQAAAARLDFQLADIVDEIDAESAALAVSGGKAAAPAASADPNAANDGAHIADENTNLAPDSMDGKQFKRWSRAPVLPELDFGSTSSLSSLDDTEAHETPPEALIDAISAAVIAAFPDVENVPFTSDNPKELTYRCDIHAKNSTSHQSIEQACQELVTKAGGQMISAYFYSGGFLFSLPPSIPEPIRTCELPAHGGKIEVERWTEFPEPKFNGLRMHPPNRVKNSCNRPVSRSGMAEQLQSKSRAGNRHGQTKKWMENDGVAVVLEKPEGELREPTSKADPITAEEMSRGAAEAADTAAGDDHEFGAAPDDASLASRSTVKCLPVIGTKLKSIKSQEMLKRVASGRGSVSQLISPKRVQSTHSIAAQRFAVVASPSESDNESGAEEWESVLSELGN